MSTPAWIPEIFAAIMILVAEVSVGQLLAARAWTRRGGAGEDIAVSRLLMGVAMAGILVPGLSFLPNVAWEIVFAAMTAWFGWRLWRIRPAAAAVHSPYARHLVLTAAMLYIFAALAAPSAAGPGMSMPGMDMPGTAGGSGLPTLRASTLALIFALLLIAFTVHDLDRQGRRFVPAVSGPAAAAATETAAERLLLSPAVEKGCQVAIDVTMAFILIITI